jgi:hypothetical protein
MDAIEKIIMFKNKAYMSTFLAKSINRMKRYRHIRKVFKIAINKF